MHRTQEILQLTKDLDDEFHRPRGSRDYKRINLILARLKDMNHQYIFPDNPILECCGDFFPWLFSKASDRKPDVLAQEWIEERA
jgi:hypothetical protein